MQELIEFASANTVLVVVFFAIIAAIIAAEIHLRVRGFKEISPLPAAQLLSSADAAAVDVNGAAEYQKGHIVNARNVPHNQLASSLKSLESLKDKPVLVYCKHGNLSANAAAQLVKAGFQQVAVLKGGLTAWQGENLPVTTKRSK